MKIQSFRTPLSLSVAAAAFCLIGVAAAQPPEGRNGDADGDGKISREEAQATAQQRFDDKDVNSDGYVTQEEAKANRRARMKDRLEARGDDRGRGDRRGGKRRGERDWTALDSNGDNQVSREEATSKALDRFEASDTNGDGVVTRDEMEARVKERKAHRKSSSSDE